MRYSRYFLPLVWAVIIASVCASCKTTEENFRYSYETARQKADEGNNGIDGTVYDRIRNEAIRSHMVSDGDTIPLNTINVAAVKDVSTPDDVKRYSVAVAQFKQLFNAKSMASRLRERGYDGATVVMTAEPLYYVIAAGADTNAEATALWRKVRADKQMVMKAPFPWILAPSSYPVR